MSTIDETTKQKIIAEYVANIRIRVICRKHGIKGSQLRALCKELNLPKRNQNSINRKTRVDNGENCYGEIICSICGAQMGDLTNHIKKIHVMSVDAYVATYNSPIVSATISSQRSETARNRYKNNPELREMVSNIGKQNITKVNAEGKGWRMPVGYHTDAHKEHMRQLMTGRDITWKDKIQQSHWSKNEEKRKEITEKHSIRMADLVANGMQNIHLGKFKKGEFISEKTKILEHYDSSYELKRMQELDADESVLSWTKKHKIRIPYMFNGCKKHYVPDFLIIHKNGIFLEEVKGYINDANQFILKYNAGVLYCLMKQWRYTLNLSYIDQKRKTLWEEKLGLR